MRLTITMLALALSGPTITEAKAEKRDTQWLSGWQQQNGSNGINAQCRQHKNKINQCKFSAVVDESFTALSAVIVDVENHKSWAKSVQISEKLSPQASQKDIYVYTTYDFVGAYDRDAVLHYSAEQDSETKTVKITFKTVDKDVPKTDLRLIRFPLLAGYWQFKPLANGQTKIEHMSFAPPGGVVQKSLYYFYNLNYVGASIETIQSLLREAKKAKYQKAKLNFIGE